MGKSEKKEFFICLFFAPSVLACNTRARVRKKSNAIYLDQSINRKYLRLCTLFWFANVVRCDSAVRYIDLCSHIITPGAVFLQTIFSPQLNRNGIAKAAARRKQRNRTISNAFFSAAVIRSLAWCEIDKYFSNFWECTLRNFISLATHFSSLLYRSPQYVVILMFLMLFSFFLFSRCR